MWSSSSSVVTFTALLGFVVASPVALNNGSAPVDSDTGFVTGFPICGTLGYTQEPGDNNIGVYPQGSNTATSPHVNVTWTECIDACRHNTSCNSISYAENYQLCQFYQSYMFYDHLVEDTTSYFEHWDQVCGEESQ